MALTSLPSRARAPSKSTTTWDAYTQRSRSTLELVFDTLVRWGPWHDLDVGRPLAAPLEQCAQLLGVDLATVRELANKIEPYLRADGTRIWSLTQLERQLRPELYGRRRGGYLDRRRTRQ